MPSNRQPSVVLPGPGKLSAGQVPASALAFPVGEAELGGKELAVSASTTLATAGGGGVASIILPIGTFVGDSNTYPLSLLFDVVDDVGKAILVAGVKVVVASISGAVVGSMFTPGTVTINLSPTIPSGRQYQVYYQRRSTLSSLSVDAITYGRVSASSAAGIAYGGSSWVSATTVEAAIDEIVTDLADFTLGNSGAQIVGHQVSDLWADGSSIAQSTIGDCVNDIVSGLASTTNGAAKIGTTVAGTWANGTSVTSTTVQTALAEIVSDLASTANGAAKVGVTVSGLWADATSVSSTNVQTALTEIVSDLAGTTGADKIGVTIANTWADASGLASTNVAAAIEEIVSDLAGASGADKIGVTISQPWATAGGFTQAAGTVSDGFNSIVDDLAQVGIATTSGASRIAVFPSSFSNALTSQGGGGLLTSTAQIQSALQQANDQLVARRAWTKVITDGSSSTGGDFNGTDITGAFNISQGGSWFFRRGLGYVITANASSTQHPISWYGELINLADNTTIRYTGASALVWTPRSGDYSLGSSFENLFFRVLDSSNRRWQFSDGHYRFTNCQASAGAMNFSAGVGVSPGDVDLDINGLTIAADDDNSTLDHGIAFFGSGSGEGIFGTVTNLRVYAVPTTTVAAKSGVLISGADDNTTKETLTFQSCHIQPDGYNAGNGYAVFIQNNLSPVVFRGCHIRAITSANVIPLRIEASGNLLFEDCLITTSDATSVLEIENCSSLHPIVFRKCEFLTGASPVILKLINSDNVVFEDCVVRSFGGPLLKVDTCSGIDFVRTTFITSVVSPNDGEIEVYTSSTISSKPVRFKDCYVDIKHGSTALSRRIALNANASTGAQTGTGSLEIDGLEIRLTHTSGLNDNLFVMYPGITNGKNTKVKNLTFRLNGQPVLASGSAPINFFGDSTDFTHIDTLNLYDLAGPSSSAPSASLVRLVKAGVSKGIVQVTTAGSDFTFAVFNLDDLSYVDDVQFYTTGTDFNGRLFRVVGDSCAMRRNKLTISSIAGVSGYLMDAVAANYVSFENNTIVISNITNSLTAQSLINLDSNSHYGSVQGNTVYIADTIKFVASSGNGVRVSNNFYRATSVGGTDLIGLFGDDSAAIGNVLHLNGGVPTITNSGTGNVVASNVLASV